MSLRAAAIAFLPVLALLAASCDTTPVQPASKAGSELDAYFGSDPYGFNTPTNAARPNKPSQTSNTALLPGSDDPMLDWSDPCTANLDEINGALLVYFGLHKSLPPTLDDIPKQSPSGAKISLTCPVSGKRYAYFPQGLRPPILVDQNNKPHTGTLLVLYDAVDSHQMVQHLTDGKKDYDMKKKVRFGIVMDPHSTIPGQPVQMYVVPIEQNLLDMYLRNSEQSIPVAPPRPAPGAWQ